MKNLVNQVTMSNLRTHNGNTERVFAPGRLVGSIVLLIGGAMIPILKSLRDVQKAKKARGVSKKAKK